MAGWILRQAHWEVDMKIAQIVSAAALSAGLALATMFSSATAQAQDAASALNGNICVGTMTGDGGSGGAAAFLFSEQGGALAARHYYALGYTALTSMTQTMNASATPGITGLQGGGFVTNLQIAGPVVTFDQRGQDPKTGYPVIFRSYRLTYNAGRLTGQSTPQNAVMQNGFPGTVTDFNLKCYTATQR